MLGGRIGPVEIIVVLALILLFFGGRGKISAMMGDMAKGIKSFRKGLKEGDQPESSPQAQTAPGSLNDPINVSPQKDTTKV